MRLEWLEDILAVAETGSLSAAAERRRLTQSAFSRRIRQIEDHVGVELFDRTRKPIALKPTTEEQREQIGRIARALRDLEHDLRQGADSAARRIVIASQHALTTSATPAIIEALGRSTPRLFVRLVSANLDECFAQLLARQADIALVYRPPGLAHPVRPDFVEVAEVGRDWLVPVIGAGHRARVETDIAQGALSCVTYPGDVFLGQLLERQILAGLRQTLQVSASAETALTLAALEIASAGVAVAWVPLSLADGRIAAGSLADLSDLLPRTAMDVTAVRLAGPSGASVQAAWDMVVRFGGSVQ